MVYKIPNEKLWKKVQIYTFFVKILVRHLTKTKFFVIQDKNSKGITLIEVVVAIFILTLLFGSVVLYTDPVGMRQKSRDNKRLSDLATLERIIIEYRLDNERYPDDAAVLRSSNSLPLAESLAFSNAQSGWINEDFRNYHSFLPIDPLNNSDHYYTFLHDLNTYELNARLEKLNTFAQNDGGDDPDVYEIGNNLTLISP